MNRKGFTPLNSQLELIANWEQNLSAVEKQIKDLNEVIKKLQEARFEVKPYYHISGAIFYYLIGLDIPVNTGGTGEL